MAKAYTAHPAHIAFLMDGNGRWAKRRLLPRTAGHHAGVKALTDTISNCIDFNIKYVTFYAFSTENWKRPAEEIETLFQMFRDFMRDNAGKYREKDVRIIILGDKTKFPEDMQEIFERIERETAHCRTLNACFAFNYGARDEILLAAKRMSDANDSDYSHANFSRYLYTAGIPDPDIIVRTGGDIRLSNFLLYQAAYAELFFCKCFWPDFNKSELKKILKEFAKRDRRFGGIK